VNGPGSKEHYRDIKAYTKLDEHFERVYQEPNDWILRVPFRSYAHLIRPEENGDLKLYVKAIDEQPLSTIWRGPNRLDVSGEVPDGMLAAVKVNYDPGWVATQDGNPVAIERDSLGYMIVQAKPAQNAQIRLRFSSTLEQRAFALISMIAWGWSFVKLWRARRLDNPESADLQAQRFARA
jgi:hypothetical protein